MRPFVPARWWAPGDRHLHVYALPEAAPHPALARLIGRARGVAARYDDVVRVVPPQHLHATVAAGGPDGDRGAVVDAVAHAIGEAGVGPVRLRMGSAAATRSAVLLDGDDIDGDWARLCAATARGLRAVCGRSTIPTAPHITIAYGTGDADSGPIGSDLRDRCRPPHAAWTIGSVWVVDVDYDPDRTAFEWSTVGRVNLSLATTAGDAP